MVSHINMDLCNSAVDFFNFKRLICSTTFFSAVTARIRIAYMDADVLTHSIFHLAIIFEVTYARMCPPNNIMWMIAHESSMSLLSYMSVYSR